MLWFLMLGCAEAEGGGLRVMTSPLELPQVGRACYSLEVVNAQEDVVFARNGICSDDFGNVSGSMTYVSTCDSRHNPNRVSVSLDGVWDVGEASVTDFVNPCPPEKPCFQFVGCGENRDTIVYFDMTIIRGAGQGFFDISVELGTAFCSAKAESCAGEAPNLFLQGEDGTRQHTMIMAVACSAGPLPKGADPAHTTVILPDLLEIFCQDGPAMDKISIDNFEEGAHTVGAGLGIEADYVVYRGDEALQCGDGSCNKSYLNVAINLEKLAAQFPDCVGCWRVGAVDGPATGYESFEELPEGHPVIGFGLDGTSLGWGYACLPFLHEKGGTPQCVEESLEYGEKPSSLIRVIGK